MIAVEVEGLEVFGRHGVGADERARGQAFLYDLRLELSEPPRSDRIEDTVDYVAVAELVKEISGERDYRLLETLAAAVADAIADRFDVAHVRVRVRKRDVKPAGLTVAWTAATAERP